jgi:CBS domain-containing protein
MKVKDVMSTNVITVNPDTNLKELAKVIYTNRINGVPVVKSDGSLVGVITMTDLLQILKHICFWDEIGNVESDESSVVSIKEALQKEKDKAVVGAKMTKTVHTVKEDDSVDFVLRLMCKYEIHTIPVVRDGKLVGIIGASDIINSCI